MKAEGAAPNGRWKKPYGMTPSRVPVGATTATLEHHQGDGYRWDHPVSIPCRVAGNEMELSIPCAALGLSPGDGFDFKWADNIRQTGAWIDFTRNGDAAPNDRYNFRAVFPR